MPTTRLQQNAAKILNAQRAGARLLERTSQERNAVMSMSRDELAALAQQMIAVASIAEAQHLEKVSVGSLSSDFPPPTE